MKIVKGKGEERKRKSEKKGHGGIANREKMNTMKEKEEGRKNKQEDDF